MSKEPGSEFTCVDGGTHDFKISDMHPRKNGKNWELHLFFFCVRCLKAMNSTRIQAGGEEPVWWPTEPIQNQLNLSKGLESNSLSP